MSDLQIFNFEENQVRTVVINNDVWFVGKDVCDILGIGNANAAFSRLKDYEKGVDSIATKGGNQSMTVVSDSGVKRLVSTSRKPKAKEVAETLGIECYVSPIEADCIRILLESFQHLNPVQQFYVSGYRIDLYFPEHRLAVECDENAHKGYNEKQEIERQDNITKLLGCKFIRFNPNEVDFSIGKVINQIILEVQ